MDTITGVARIFQRGGGAKRESEATEWAEGVCVCVCVYVCVCVWGGVSPYHCREIFKNSCIKITFFLHIKRLFFYLFYSPINGGGGAWPIVPSLATLKTVV